MRRTCSIGTLLRYNTGWNTPKHPDPQGTQLMKIIKHLRENPGIQLIWFDYISAPQEPRSADETDYFRRTLDAINYLYLCYDVLVIYDLAYMSWFMSPGVPLISVKTVPDSPQQQLLFWLSGSAPLQQYLVSELGGYTGTPLPPPQQGVYT